MGNGELNNIPRIEPSENIESESQKLERIMNSIIEKQGGTLIMADPILQRETEELYKRENSMCSINFETHLDGITKNDGLGTGFFCKFNSDYFPFKKALFTNNHILDEESIKTGKTIKFQYQKKDITIEITEKRNAFTDKELDYTCVEIFDEDGIEKFFEIDTDVTTNTINKNILKNQQIFVLQYTESRELSLSAGKILHFLGTKMIHSAVTNKGSSGSPLIRRNRKELNFVVGIHFGTIKNHKYGNLATPFDNILEDLKLKIIESSKIKIKAHIKIPSDNYKARIINSSENVERERILKIDYSNVVKNEEEIKNCMIFINKEKIDFTYEYTFRNKGEYEIIYIFNNLLNSTNFIFYECRDLSYLDFTNFNTQNVTNMSNMFCGCESLKELILTGLNTEKVTNMSWMFNECILLRNLDLSSFRTSLVKDMSQMFNRCESLVNLNISTFDTKQVTSMLFMFWGCKSLIKLNLSHFATENVENMQGMFRNCVKLKELDLSSFNTEKVTNMLEMFNDCTVLEKLNLKNFNTTNCENMLGMFADCKFLSELDLSKFNTKNLKHAPWLFAGCNSLRRDKVIANDERLLHGLK